MTYSEIAKALENLEAAARSLHHSDDRITEGLSRDDRMELVSLIVDAQCVISMKAPPAPASEGA